MFARRISLRACAVKILPAGNGEILQTMHKSWKVAQWIKKPFSLIFQSAPSLFLFWSRICGFHQWLAGRITEFKPTEDHQIRFRNLKRGFRRFPQSTNSYHRLNPHTALTNQMISRMEFRNPSEYMMKQRQPPLVPKQQENCLRIQISNTCLCKLHISIKLG